MSTVLLTHEDENGSEHEIFVEYEYTPSYAGDKGFHGEPLSPQEPSSVSVTGIKRKEPVGGIDNLQWVDFWDSYIDLGEEAFEELEGRCLEHHESES